MCSTPSGDVSATPVHDESVLIVEDDDSVRTAYTEALGLQGYRVAGARDGKTALAEARGGDWSVAVVDLVLPDLGGIELIRELKSLDPDLCVIVMTNYASLESAMEAVRAGAYDYLCKPLDVAELERVVTRGAETRRLALRNRELVQRLASTNSALEQQSRRLEEKLTAAQREMSALVALGIGLGAETSMSSALVRILDVAASLTQARGSAILLHDEARAALVGYLARGAAPLDIETVVHPLGHGFVGAAAAGEAAVVDNEVLLHARDEDAFLRGLGVRRVLAVPLRAQGALQGVMILFDRSEGPFNDHDRSAATVLAQFAASIIDAFRLRESVDGQELEAEGFVPIHELLRR